MKIIRIIVIAAIAAIASDQTLAQAPAVGQLLVSNTSLRDPNFAETVMLILFHNDEIGSAGVMINRPTWVNPGEAFPEDDGLQNFTGELYLGGPVAPTDIWTVFESDGAIPEEVQAQPLGESIWFNPGTRILESVDFSLPDAPRVRIYAGRAEWGPGQLEREIDRDSWRVVPFDANYVFSEDPSTLWQRMPRMTGSTSASVRDADERRRQPELSGR
jgi:putative transcriptional regulator